MRILKLILFTITLALACSITYGQAPTRVAFGGTRPIDTAWAGRHLRIDSTVRFLKYSTADATKYLRVNASGFLELGTPAGGGGNADSATFFTNYRADTMRSNIYGQLALKGSGTVTNVSTGFGMLGGPVTTTGTVRVDSNAVLTVARGYKITDSVAYLDSIRLADTSLNLRAVFAADLAGYVPYTGATSNTNTGEYGIKAGQYDLDLTPTGTYTTGTTYWDATHLAPATYLNSSVTQVNGQTFYMRGRNNTGTTIAKGKAVYVNNAQGNNPTISLADADSVTTSQVIGITAESISDGGTGYVMVSGYLDGVNTSAYADGDALYLDTVNGNLTNQLLPSPHNVVFVAYALNSTVNGRYFIRPSSPIASDTTMTAGSNQIAPTQAAVKKYVTTAISGKINYTDTVSLSNRINTKQSYSDTSTWDATRSWVTGQIPSLTGYATTAAVADSVSGRVKYSDTVTLIGTQYQIDTAAYNALTRINTKGTVTSVALANGFGISISGSPVTGTGTITATVDTTTVIATTSDINTAVATKVNYTDTVAMSNRISLLNTVKGSDVASADTINLLTATGNYVNVTGTTQIRALSPSASANSALIGLRRVVQFTGALTLTYNATTNILPGSANITTVAGDMAEFVYEGGVSWRCINYTKRTWTGTGSVMLAASPSTTGTLTAAAITASGTISMTGATVTLGSSTSNSTVGLGTGNTTTGNTKTINIGGAAASGSTQNINIGSTAASGSTQAIVIGSTAATNTVTVNGTTTLQGTVNVTGTMSVTGTAAFTSTVTATTTAASDSTTNVATTAFVNSRIQTITTTNFTTSYTINSSNKYNVQLNVTAQAGALLFNNPTGTWVNNQMILGSVQDNGTNRAITWDTKWVGANGATLPSTTTTGRPLIWVALYNSFQDRYYVSLL